MAAGECRHLDFLYRYWRIPQDPTGRLPGTGMLRSGSGVVRKSVSIEIELIDSEFSCIAVPACIQRHVFANVCRANQIPTFCIQRKPRSRPG